MPGPRIETARRTLMASALCLTFACGGEDAAPRPPTSDDGPVEGPPPTPTPTPEPPPPPPPTTTSAFEITLAMGDGITPRQAAALEAARDRWQEVVIGDLSDLTVDAALLEDACGMTAATDPVTIDDLLIVARAEPVDGPGNVVGRAGPCLTRGRDGAPLVGIIELDTDDLEVLESAGVLQAVLTHELGHILGIGTLWGRAGLIENPSLPDDPDADTRFIGAEASQIATTLIGSQGGVPVENGAVAGSSDGHWRERVFANELMTPALGGLNGPPPPLSLLTIASLEDLGFYEINRDAADPYEPPASPASASRSSTHSCELIRPSAYVAE